MNNTKLIITFIGLITIFVYTIFRFKANKKKMDDLLKTRMDKIKAMQELAEEAEKREKSLKEDKENEIKEDTK